MKIKRRPPPKIHQLFPKDVVELSHKKNDDWKKGQTAEIKHINYRAPNTLQIESEDVQDSTFISSTDVIRVETGSISESNLDQNQERSQRYMLWP